MFNILLVILFPILLVQAIIVRRKALVLPEAEGNRSGQIRVHGVEDSDIVNFLMLGDSVAAGVGTKSIDQSLAGACIKVLMRKNGEGEFSKPFDVHWQIIAESGKRLHQLVKDIEQQNIDIKNQRVNYHHTHVIISIGVNDITRWTHIDIWREQLTHALNLLVKKYKNVEITLIAIPEMAAFPLLPFPLNRILGQRCKQINLCSKQVIVHFPQVKFCHLSLPLKPSFFAADGFHPSKEACELLAFEIMS